MEPLFCPYANCSGILKYISGTTTLAGFTYLNENEVWETFECKVCQRNVCRSWKWKEAQIPRGEGE